MNFHHEDRLTASWRLGRNATNRWRSAHCWRSPKMVAIDWYIFQFYAYSLSFLFIPLLTHKIWDCILVLLLFERSLVNYCRIVGFVIIIYNQSHKTIIARAAGSVIWTGLGQSDRNFDDYLVFYRVIRDVTGHNESKTFPDSLHEISFESEQVCSLHLSFKNFLQTTAAIFVRDR